MKPRLLERLAAILPDDFHEYSARPYAGVTAKALENLHDFAEHREVRRGANMALDYYGRPTFLISASGVFRPGWESGICDRVAINAAISQLVGNPVLGPLLGKTAAQSLINVLPGRTLYLTCNDPDADGTRYRSLKDDPDRRSTRSGKAE